MRCSKPSPPAAKRLRSPSMSWSIAAPRPSCASQKTALDRLEAEDRRTRDLLVQRQNGVQRCAVDVLLDRAVA
jgi:hypothetical protein